MSFTSFAAKVNGAEIPMLEFERELQQTQNQYQQLYRIELTDDLRRELRRSVIDQMIMREALLQQADDVGYRVSDQRLGESIRETEAFQVGGEFSGDAYRALLASEGFTPAGFEALQRQQLELVEFQNGVAASTFLTPAEYRRYIELANERREIAYALFSVEGFLDQVEITDAAVAEHHAANPNRYMTDESVDLQYLSLDLASAAADIEVTEEELRAFYENEPDRFGTAEERKVSHILIEVEGDDYAAAEAEAARVRERVDAGEDFATLAAELSDDAGTRNQGGDLGWISRGLLEGPFEDTLFGMSTGSVAGPVETEFGYHVLKLDDIRSGDVQPFEAVRDELRAELASNEASALFFDRANEMADAAFDAFDELTSVAEELDLPLQTIDGFTRAGDPARFTDDGPIIAAAFDEDAILTGENSDLLELSDDEVAVIRVAAHHPPMPQPLEAVADEIREELARDQAELLASDAAEAFLEALGSDYEQAPMLAEMHGGTWMEAAWAERRDTEFPAALVALAFAQPKPAEGEVITRVVPLGSGDEAVMLLSAVEAGNPDAIDAEQREQGRRQIANQVAQMEMAGYADDVRARATVRVPDEVLNPQF